MNTDLEERLRRALAARAGQVTPGRLRPASPPTAAPARRSWRSWRTWWPPLLVLAAALVAVAFAVRLPTDPPRVPDAPAATVPATSPSPSAAPTGPAPTASPSTSALEVTAPATKTLAPEPGTSPPPDPTRAP